MKKNFLISIMAIMIACISYANEKPVATEKESVNDLLSEKATGGIKIIIEIGKKVNGNDCKFGFGFCNISIAVSSTTKGETGNFIPAIIYVKGQEFIVAIEESIINNDPTLLNNLINRENAIFETGFNLPVEITRELGLRANFSVEKGKYPITHENKTVLIHFPM